MMYDFEQASNGITSVQNFMKIRPATLELHAYGLWCHHKGWHCESSQAVVGNGLMAEDCRLTQWLWASVALVLLIVGDQEVLLWSNVRWHHVHTKFHTIASSHSRVVIGIRWRHRERHQSLCYTEFADHWNYLHLLKFFFYGWSESTLLLFYWYYYHYYIKWYGSLPPAFFFYVWYCTLADSVIGPLVVQSVRI